MAPELESLSYRTSPKSPNRLEAQIPSETLEKIGRHLAGHAFLGDFLPLKRPESLFEVLRSEMNEQIIEQPAAIDAIISSLDKRGVRSEKDNRPIATLAFLGPTGVGKSQTAKVLADLIVGGKGNLIKIDCSNYSSGHEVSSLTGSPPGYVGRDQKPVLNKERVETPGTVVLFDEIEKGSKELNNLLLQVNGDGELRLNNGDVVSFKDTIIIITSNLGAKELSAQMSNYFVGFGSHEVVTDKNRLEKTAIKAFTDFFPPEFSNRFDKLVVFHPLSNEGMAKVLGVKLNTVNKQYEDEYGAKISLTDATVNHLVSVAQEQPQFGARPMVRAFEENIQTTFGRYVGSKSLEEGTHIRVFHRNEFPDDYQHSDDRELIFASKRDDSIKRKVSTEVELHVADELTSDSDSDSSIESEPFSED